MTQTQTPVPLQTRAVRPKNNGAPEKTPEEIAVENAVQHHVASYQRLVAQCNELQDRLNKTEQLLTIHKIELEGMRAEKAAAETRVLSYQTERDEAVTNLAVYQTLFITLQGVLRTFGIEHAPLVKEPPRETDQTV